MSHSGVEEIRVAPAPWTLKGIVYTFAMHVPATETKTITAQPRLLFSKLEAGSSFAQGKYVGGFASVQIIRYSETPVGPYDEMALIPGRFEYDRDGGKEKLKQRRNLRCTQIYVSQKHTCWNGRKNWNIPKHLARFSFSELPNNGISISVYPHECSLQGIETASSRPAYFSATYTPIPYLPTVPFSTKIAEYLGIDLSLAQPPLPEGNGTSHELPGTHQWCQARPCIWSPKVSLGWWDLRQSRRANEKDELDEDSMRLLEGSRNENWWPGLGRWKLGMKMEYTTISLGMGEHWDDPRL